MYCWNKDIKIKSSEFDFTNQNRFPSICVLSPIPGLYILTEGVHNTSQHMSIVQFPQGISLYIMMVNVYIGIKRKYEKIFSSTGVHTTLLMTSIGVILLVMPMHILGRDPPYHTMKFLSPRAIFPALCWLCTGKWDLQPNINSIHRR